jgi:hypothetical protein
MNIQLQEWPTGCSIKSMAKPDLPNFSILGRIVFGIIAIAVIYLLLRFFGYIP